VGERGWRALMLLLLFSTVLQMKYLELLPEVQPVGAGLLLADERAEPRAPGGCGCFFLLDRRSTRLPPSSATSDVPFAVSGAALRSTASMAWAFASSARRTGSTSSLA
jgi:hypothetical protein